MTGKTDEKCWYFHFSVRYLTDHPATQWQARHRGVPCPSATPALRRAGLASFVSDARSNPLRINLFEVRGITVIADYAHNAAAYSSLAELARAMTAGAVVGVVTSPGDRRDEDLHHTGKACGAGFDKRVVYESASRGRPFGQAAALIVGTQHVIPAEAGTNTEADQR